MAASRVETLSAIVAVTGIADDAQRPEEDERARDEEHVARGHAELPDPGGHLALVGHGDDASCRVLGCPIDQAIGPHRGNSVWLQLA